jgi:hypothetical protein
MILAKLITKSSNKYVAIQTEVNKMLVSCDPDKTTIKNLEKYLDKMAFLESRLGQASKAYEILFKEEFDFEHALKQAVRKSYSKSAGRAARRVAGSETDKELENENFEISSDIDENAPPELQAMLRKLKKWGAKKGKEMGKDMRVEMIDVSDPKQTMGLKPKDFGSFRDFIKAVNAAKIKQREIEEGKVSAEDAIVDAVIHKAEKDSQNSKEDNTIN